MLSEVALAKNNSEFTLGMIPNWHLVVCVCLFVKQNNFSLVKIRERFVTNVRQQNFFLTPTKFPSASSDKERGLPTLPFPPAAMTLSVLIPFAF